MKVQIFLILYTVSTSMIITVGFTVFTSEEKELIYDYNAIVTVSSNHSKNYATKFYLTGKLHVQRQSTSLLLRLSSLTFKLYNGLLRDDYEDIIDEIPISNEYEDLLRIFKIDYDSGGRVDNITTEIRENLHARNLKKSLATILQIDVRCVSDNKTQAFETVEVFLWENNTVFYNVTKVPDGFVIEKQRPQNSTFISDSCSIKDDYPPNSIFRYFVNNMCQVERIQSIDTFNFKENFIVFNQTLELTETDLVTERFQIYDEETQNLTYVTDELVLIGITKEATLSGFEVKSSAIYNHIQELILEIQLVNNGRPNILKSTNLVDQLFYLLRSFETLETLYQRISDWSLGNKQYLAILHQFLPYIGTNASLFLIKRLIRTNSITEQTSVDLLTQLPFYIAANANLENLEDFLYLDDTVHEVIRRTATLCFANILSQKSDAREYNKTCLKYTNYFIDKFKTSVDYDTKLFYIVAASNTNCAMVQPFLISLMHNNSYSLAMRQWAMRRLPYLVKPSQAVFDIFWPIFNDVTQLLNIRKTAYALIIESKPSLPQLLQVHNHIDKENNVKLYEFHYSYFTTLSKSAYLCHEDSLLKILNIVQKRNRTEPTGYYELFLNVGLSVFLTYDKTTTFMRFKENDDKNPNSLLVSVDGAQATFDSSFKNLTFLIPNINTMKIDVILTHNYQVTQIKSFNITNLQNLEKMLSLFLNEKSMRFKYNLHFKQFPKTNFGIPFQEEISEIVINRQNWSVHKNTSNFFRVRVKGNWNDTKILQNKLKFYNPIADAWQGVKSYQTKNLNINMNVDVNVFVQKGAYKVFFGIDLNRNFENYDNNLTISGIFINEGTYYNEVLSKSCESCQNWYILN